MLLALLKQVLVCPYPLETVVPRNKFSSLERSDQGRIEGGYRFALLETMSLLIYPKITIEDLVK